MLRLTDMPRLTRDDVNPCKGGRAVVLRTTPAPVGHPDLLRA